jgi:DNA-binding transcriptional LysR family regulator
MPRTTLRRFYRHGMLPQLLVFEAVARLESVTRAAEALHLAQPTVSTQLRKLSDALGVTLFELRGRRIALTAAGRELRGLCEELIALLERAEARLAALRAPSADVLRVAAAPGARRLAALLLAGFCGRHPGIHASLHVANRAALRARLDAGEDEIYLFCVPRDAQGVTAQPIASERLLLCAGAGTRFAGRRALALGELAGEPLVLREEGSGTRAALLGLFAARGLRLKPVLELASDESVAEAVAGGSGIALLPESVARALLASGALVDLRCEGLPLTRQWSLAHAAGRALSPAAALFLREALAEGTRLDGLAPGANNPRLARREKKAATP